MDRFKLKAEYNPKGDQQQAIDSLSKGIKQKEKYQVLLGVTGSGKTFTMANVIAKLNKPTLIISHNKTLAAQLYSEFRQFFPENAVEYFVSYYDYYQPEAYIPHKDVYIEKDSSINEKIDRLRLKATSSLLERKDVIIVASVSCIYGIGSPEEWEESLISLQEGRVIMQGDLLRSLVDIQYERNEMNFSRGKFRVRGDVIEVFPAYLETALRIEFFGDKIDKISEINPLTGRVLKRKNTAYIYPAKHFVTTAPRREKAIKEIRKELDERLKWFDGQGKPLEAERLNMRTNNDIEMMQEIGVCHGVENYSRHLSGRKPGQAPACLINYFPKDFLLIIDESHVAIPQIRGMYAGDRARKENLINYGFRLPSALDNRPLKFNEFEKITNQVIYVSATPGPYELEKSKGEFIEQIIRPTGLVDPIITVKPIEGQIKDLIFQVKQRIAKKQRTLITTLTKRMAEDLSDYLHQEGLCVRYLHSEINVLKRIEILQSLRKGDFDVLVGINLLREGLDLPEVSLVIVLDADKEGFLRSETSLIQVCGRAARNVDGEVIMYADSITGSMKRAINETQRRRKIQTEYNEQYNIIPQTIQKAIREGIEEYKSEKQKISSFVFQEGFGFLAQKEKGKILNDLKRQMKEAANELDFELAIILRDKINQFNKKK